jgi:MFS family permease
VLAALVLGNESLGNEGWRWLFVLGVVPAVFTLWIRRNVPESHAWVARTPTPRRENPLATIFGRALIGRTLRIIALGAAVQFAYWGLFFWLPPFLSRPIEQGGAGMGVVGSLQWIIFMQVGAYLGYLTFGFIADKLGRRRTFILFMLCAAAIVPVYGQMARSPMVLLALSPLLGYFGHGYFSMFGGLIAELFPVAVRATGQGTSYNLGRMAGAVAPFTIGAVATLPGIGIGLALGVTSAFFLAAALLVLTLPDRSGQPLE